MALQPVEKPDYEEAQQLAAELKYVMGPELLEEFVEPLVALRLAVELVGQLKHTVAQQTVL